MGPWSLRIAFEPNNPALASDLCMSLNDWLADAIASNPECQKSLRVDVEQGDPTAQGGLTELIVHSLIEGGIAGAVVGIVHVTSENAFKTLLPELMRWWVQNEKPILSIKAIDGSNVTINRETPDPHAEMERVARKGGSEDNPT
jgi:hypothetical protein